MKENKDIQIKFRLTATMKEQIDNYCESNDITVSQLMRLAVKEFFNKEED